LARSWQRRRRRPAGQLCLLGTAWGRDDQEG